MTHLDPDEVERGLQLLAASLVERPEVLDELRSSRREFMTGPAARTGVTPDVLTQQRHLEWFLLERESPVLGAVPIVAAMDDPRIGLDPRVAQALHASHASVFEVTGVDPGRGAWLRDLAGLGEYPALLPQASVLLEPGDLIAGRMYPLGESISHVSRAAGTWRSSTLLDAVRSDLARARTGRRASLRLSQPEIEAMFFRPPDVIPPGSVGEDPVGEARAALVEDGIPDEDIDEIFAELSRSEPAAAGVLPGAGDALGEILARLAFETQVDLERARRLLLLAWAALRGADGPAGPAPAAEVAPPARARDDSADPDAVARAVAEFERKRKAGAPLERAFQELERDLDLVDPGAASDEEDAPAPDFPGVVAAMIEEFLWETRADGDPGLERLRSLGRHAADIGVFENLRGRDLLEFASRRLPESGELDGAAAAMETVRALRRFARWVEEAHELPLHTEIETQLDELEAVLPRLAEANARCAPANGSVRATGELFDCQEMLGPPRARVLDSAGVSHVVRIEPQLHSWLRQGDRIRGRLEGGEELAVTCCYPPTVRETDDS